MPDSTMREPTAHWTDSSNSAGIDPTTAAQEAADRGVRVYTIGFGTDNPAGSACTGSQVSTTGGFGTGGRGAAPSRRSTRTR